MLSVIIPTCNRNDLLAQCLDCLSPTIQTIQETYEVIVTDDSKDNTAKDLVKNDYGWVKWVAGPKRGPAANRNNGAKEATGELLVFIDDDCLPDKNILNIYLITSGNKIFGGFEGKIIAEKKQERFDEVSPINIDGGNFWSCNIAVRKDLFFMIKGFDEGFPYPAMEDTDFYQRLQVVTKIKFIPDALVVHPFRIAKPFTSYNKWLSSHKYIMDKNCTPRDFRYRMVRAKIFLSFMFFETKSLLKYKLTGFLYYLELNYVNLRMIFL